MNWKRIIQGLAAALLIWLVVWVIITFSASEQTQMLRQQQKFITALEQRNWNKVDAMICNDYEDDWAQDATMVKANMRKALGNFFFLSITPEVTSTKVVKGLGMVKTRLKMEGNGAGLSPFVLAESKRLKEPWIFHWHKRGFWPWSWELVQVHNDDLHVPTGALEQ